MCFATDAVNHHDGLRPEAAIVAHHDCPTTLTEWQATVYQNAVAHGWWDEERPFSEVVALIHSEASEALEEWRAGRAVTETYHRADGKPEGIPSELADVVIRCLDAAAHYGVDIQKAIAEKHAFNVSRPFKHGKVH